MSGTNKVPYCDSCRKDVSLRSVEQNMVLPGKWIHWKSDDDGIYRTCGPVTLPACDQQQGLGHG